MSNIFKYLQILEKIVYVTVILRIIGRDRYIYIYKVFNMKNIHFFCKIFRRVSFSIT